MGALIFLDPKIFAATLVGSKMFLTYISWAQKLFCLTIFWSLNFFGPNTFRSKKCLDQKSFGYTFYSEPTFLWPIFFIKFFGLIFFWIQISYGPVSFWTLIFCVTFFWTKIFLIQKMSRPKNLRDQKLFGPNVFYLEFIGTQHFVLDQKHSISACFT